MIGIKVQPKLQWDVVKNEAETPWTEGFDVHGWIVGRAWEELRQRS